MKGRAMIKCWYYRRIIARSADEDAPLARAAEAHITECRECRRLYQTGREIVRRLSLGGAEQKRHEPPPFLAAGIMARIKSTPSDNSRASNLSLQRWSAALTACLVLTAVLLRPGHPGRDQVPVAKLHPAPHLDAPSAMNWTNTVQLAEWATHPDQPLDTEMQAVIHDARGAVMALADNFFPEQLRQTLLEKAASRN